MSARVHLTNILCQVCVCVHVCKCGARVYGGRMYLTNMSCEVGECMCVSVCSCTKVCVSVMDAITTACD